MFVCMYVCPIWNPEGLTPFENSLLNQAGGLHLPAREDSVSSHTTLPSCFVGNRH